MDFDVIVIGAGAAGLMCAIEAGKRGQRVLVLEHADKIGKKILISGGGRCNFTNLHCAPQNFLSENPHFAKSALARYTPSDFIALVERHKIPYHEKKLGQLFCDRAATDITRLLEDECRTAGVTIELRSRVTRVERKHTFRITTPARIYESRSLVIATGGLSIPKIGATSFGYDIARQFGLKIVECRPALVPLLFRERDRSDFGDLVGVAATVIARAGGEAFHERMLFTHRGLSGPAILQISSYLNGDSELYVDLLPEIAFEALVKERRAHVKTILTEFLPKRLAERWMELLSGASIQEIEQRLHGWRISPAGTEGYEKAEVTAGGVDTNELSSKTMESRSIPGLYFIGEVVDVTGHLGGFNFQWAWASGFAAGQAV